MRCKPRRASCFLGGQCYQVSCRLKLQCQRHDDRRVQSVSFDIQLTYYIIVHDMGWTSGRYQYATLCAASHVTISGYQHDAQAQGLARRASPGAGRTPFFL